MDHAPVEAAHARLALAELDPAARPGTAATARAVLPVFEAAGDAVGRPAPTSASPSSFSSRAATRRRSATTRGPWSTRWRPGPSRSGPGPWG
ncbi:hypothetical protein LUR56_14210 [Streptomyces sp. MT29]|nr:hypothetical protein [Streptomyces sp. MT29]